MQVYIKRIISPVLYLPCVTPLAGWRRGSANHSTSLWGFEVGLHTTIFPDKLTHMHMVLIILVSISSLSASWLHLPPCWFCSGRLDWAALQVILNGFKISLPIFSICLETLCLEGFFPLTSSPATSLKEGCLTTSAVTGKKLWKITFLWK